MDTRTTAEHLIDEEVPLDTPLWHFALQLWQDRDIAALCLELQAAGWSVTRLLCASWLAWQGRRFEGEPAQVAQWRTGMTAPLRAMRQSLAKESATTTALRAQLAKAELESERVELALAYADLAAAAPAAEPAFQHQSLVQRLLANLAGAGPEAKPMDRDTEAMIQRLSRQLARQLAAPMEASL